MKRKVLNHNIGLLYALILILIISNSCETTEDLLKEFPPPNDSTKIPKIDSLGSQIDHYGTCVRYNGWSYFFLFTPKNNYPLCRFNITSGIEWERIKITPPFEYAYSPHIQGQNTMGKLLFFGGSTHYSMYNGFEQIDITPSTSDLWVFDCWTGIWSQGNSMPMPPPRSNFASAFNSDSGELYVFGGVSVDSFGYQRSWRNDLWKYNLQSDTWIQLDSGSGPTPRKSSSMIFDYKQRKLYLFGGESAIEGITNQLWEYNLASNSWNQVQSNGPSPRLRTQMIYVEEEEAIYILGGYEWKSSIAYLNLSDIWKYEVNASAWTPIDNFRKFAYQSYFHPVAISSGYSYYERKIYLYGRGLFISYSLLNHQWEILPTTIVE